MAPTVIKKEKPYYLQVKESLAERIDKDLIKPGDPILSESEIVYAYNVSLTTARRALDELEAEKYIERIQGKGSFVRDPAARVQMGKIGLVLCEDRSQQPHYHNLIRVIEEQMYRANKQMVVLSVEKLDDREREKIRRISGESLEAMLLLGDITEDIYRFSSGFGVPVLVIGNTRVPLGVPQVKFGGVETGRTAAACLAECGYRQIGFLNGAHFYPTACELYQGFTEELAARDIPLPESLVYWTKERRAYHETLELLDKIDWTKPAALFCEEGAILEAVRALEIRNTRIPESLGLLPQASREYRLPDGRRINSLLYPPGRFPEKVASALQKLLRNEPLSDEDRVVVPERVDGETLRQQNA